MKSLEALRILSECANGEKKLLFSDSLDLEKIIKQDLERLQKQDEDIKSGELSDGYHTFNDLYYQRCILFASLVNQNKKTSWKSYKHEDGELCFGGGWFIVGIDTPQGSYTYHYENKYWDLFQCKELECGKHWDGHTSKDVDRLLSIKNEDLEVLEIIKKKKVEVFPLFFIIRTSEEESDEYILMKYNTRFNNKLYELTMEELLKLKQWLEVNENDR
jgi:hypothetical protein